MSDIYDSISIPALILTDILVIPFILRTNIISFILDINLITLILTFFRECCRRKFI